MIYIEPYLDYTSWDLIETNSLNVCLDQHNTFLKRCVSYILVLINNNLISQIHNFCILFSMIIHKDKVKRKFATCCFNSNLYPKGIIILFFSNVFVSRNNRHFKDNFFHVNTFLSLLKISPLIICFVILINLKLVICCVQTLWSKHNFSYCILCISMMLPCF